MLETPASTVPTIVADLSCGYLITHARPAPCAPHARPARAGRFAGKQDESKTLVIQRDAGTGPSSTASTACCAPRWPLAACRRTRR